MLQVLRERSKIPIILVFILVVICFGFFFNAQDTGLGRGAVGVRLKAGSRSVKAEEFDRLGRELALLGQLAQPSGFAGFSNPDSRSIQEFLQILQMAGPLTLDGSQGNPEDAASTNAIANLLALRAQAKEMGIGISPELVKTGITRLPLLLDAESGQFSSARLDLLRHSGLGTLGGGSINLDSFGSDGAQLLQDAVTDWLTFEDLRAALTPAGAVAPALGTAQARQQIAQTEAWTFQADAAAFQPAAEAVDEAALSAWYQQNQARYFTPESRDVIVAVAKADPAAPAENQAENSAAGGDDLLTPETGELAATEIDDASWEALRERFRAFYDDVASGADFAQAAAKQNLQLIEAKGVNNDPENLALDLGGDEALRQLAVSTRPDLSISQVNEDRALGRIAALRVAQVNPPAPRELAAVRERVLADYRQEEGTRLANAALASVRDAVTAHWAAQSKLDGFQPEEKRITVLGPRYFGGPQPVGPLDATSRTLALGTPSETLPLPAENQPPIAAVDAAPQAFGFVVPVARRIAASQQAEVEQSAEQIANQQGQAQTLFLLLDWFQRARAEAKIALPKR